MPRIYTFTRLITHALEPILYLFVLVYLDDICTYFKSPHEHLNNLWEVLIALRENKMFITIVKHFLAKRDTEYFGFVFVSGIVRASPSKVAVVKGLPLPETNKTNYVFCCLFLV